MKEARTVTFTGTETPQDAQRTLVRIRFAECLQQQHALDADDAQALHAFRLACKRLRFAIERCPQLEPPLNAAAELLSEITDDLGAAHDCVALAQHAQTCGAQNVRRRALVDGIRCVNRGQKLWRGAFKSGGTFEALARFAGYGWERA